MSIIKYCIAALATVSCMVAAAQGSVVERECWLDNNPVENQSLGASPTALDISSLPPGLHWFSMRVKDGQGVWSPTIFKAFVIPHEIDNSTATSLQGGEYWFDHNFAERHAIGSSPVTLNISSLPAGLHWFSMRVKDDLGVWSPAMTKAFIIPHEIDNSTATTIQRREVWFDDNVAERQAIGAAPVMLDISSLPAGLHRLTIRVQDDLGRWSSQKTKFFIIPHEVVEEDVVLVNYCYWFDYDVANLVVGELPVSGKTVSGVIAIDMATVPFGQHTISWMIGDSKGAWGYYTGEVNTMEFYNSLGDVNGDGNVNIADVTALISMVLSGNTSSDLYPDADCNGDGNINIADVTALIAYVLKGGW